MDGQLLDTEAAAKRLQLSASYLNKLRVTGDGPSFLKLGRAVRYRPGDLDTWAASCARASTSERAAA